MRISKSAFKNLIRCPRYSNFYISDTSSTLGNNEKLIDLLEESKIDGDLSDYDIDQLDTMNDFYTAVEIEASKATISTFGGTNKDFRSFGGQQMFSAFIDEYELYNYADIVNTTSSGVNIIEVKSCTNSKIKKLGPKIDGEYYSIFTRDGNMYSLRENRVPYFPIPDTKYTSNRTKLFDKYHEFGKYIYDVSIQRYIIEHSHNYNNDKEYHYYLAILNKDYVFDGHYEHGTPVYNPINNQELINFVEVTTITEEMQPLIQAEFNTIQAYIEANDNTFRRLGKYCMRKKITECPYLKDCFTYLSEDDIIADLSGITYTQISAFHDEGKTYIHDLELGDITNQQQLTEIDVVLNDTEWIDHQSIQHELHQLQYPLYHLDFETFTSPLPRFEGESPNDVYTFQFSIHIERSPGICDMDENHIGFLAKDHKDHREDIARKLVETIDLSNGGTVITWHKSFEKGRLLELSQSVPKYRKELLLIRDHVYDLKDIFKGKKGTNIYTYRKQMKGSFSIKYVLPAYTELSYDGMDIANGLHAMAAYASYQKLNSEQHAKIIKDLINYCKQDTWAMVKLLEVIYKIIKGDKL